jgi:hypothetical protein
MFGFGSNPPSPFENLWVLHMFFLLWRMLTLHIVYFTPPLTFPLPPFWLLFLYCITFLGLEQQPAVGILS